MLIIKTKIIFFSILFGLVGCSSNPKTNPDPFENYNRTVYQFNKTVDKIFIKPIATAYDNITPWPIKKGINNTFENLKEPAVMINDLLQGQVIFAISDLWRFALNSTLGIMGLFDVASYMGLVKRKQDFGLTLAKWGDTDSPYFIIPFFGPSTVRDTAGFLFDSTAFSPIYYIKPIHLRYGIYAGNMINGRTQLLKSDKILKDIALDPYTFERDSYLQHRQYLINKGQSNTQQQPPDIYEE